MSREHSSFQEIGKIMILWVAKELHIVVFAALALAVGLVLINNKGPFTGPDMYDAHYKSALGVATGQGFADKSKASSQGAQRVLTGDEAYFRSGGGKCVDITLVAAQLMNPLDSDDQDACIEKHDERLSSEQTTIKAIVAYPPLGYLPQASGLFVGIKTGMEPIDGQTLARTFNLLIYIVLISVSIKVAPFGKWLLVLLGLLPTSLFLASSFSPDSLNIAWSFVFIAYIVRLYFRKEKIKAKQIGILGALGFGLFMLKVAYVPLLLLILGLDGRVMKRSFRWLFVIAVAVLGSAAYLIWSKNWGTVVYSVDLSVNSSIILHDLPAAIGGVLINILFTPYKIFETNQSMYVFFAIVLGWLAVSHLRKINIARPDDLFDFFDGYKLHFYGILAAVGSLGITYAALLVTWTDISEYGFLDIKGFQGRYILPLLPLLLLAYSVPQKTRKRATDPVYSTARTKSDRIRKTR